MKEFWDMDKIKEILPQRPPFLFVDKVIDIDRVQGTVVCVKNVSINEYFFKGHFPGNPVMPGVIMLEALAQSSIILYAVLKPDIASKKPVYYLGKCEVKFKRVVKPGDQLVIEVRKEKLLDRGGIVSAVGKVSNEAAIEAQISFGVRLPDAK